MPKSLVLAALLAGPLLVGGAYAQAPANPDIVRGLCSKDGCDEFAILDRQPVSTGFDGQLFRTRVRVFHASSAGRRDDGEENGFVYCSTARPAIVAAPPGRAPLAFMLAPDEQAPAYVQRNSTNFYALYFSLCHGIEAGRAAVRDRQGTARSLGYRVARQTAGTVALKSIDDIVGTSR